MSASPNPNDLATILRQIAAGQAPSAHLYDAALYVETHGLIDNDRYALSAEGERVLAALGGKADDE